jgi:hypothetical protein
MVSNRQVRWTKAQRARLAGDGERALYAVGVEGVRVGRWEQTGLMDAAKALFLASFANHLYRGMSARSAFEQAGRDMTEEGLARVAVEATAGQTLFPEGGD